MLYTQRKLVTTGEMYISDTTSSISQQLGDYWQRELLLSLGCRVVMKDRNHRALGERSFRLGHPKKLVWAQDPTDSFERSGHNRRGWGSQAQAVMAQWRCQPVNVGKNEAVRRHHDSPVCILLFLLDLWLSLFCWLVRGAACLQEFLRHLDESTAC